LLPLCPGQLDIKRRPETAEMRVVVLITQRRSVFDCQQVLRAAHGRVVPVASDRAVACGATVTHGHSH
jgi:hypothetical protein